MTAGAGILHIETPPESLVMSGGLFHGFQLWVNLPQLKSGHLLLIKMFVQKMLHFFPRAMVDHYFELLQVK